MRKLWLFVISVFLIFYSCKSHYNMSSIDYTTTETGLKYRILEAGKGKKAHQGDLVQVHYTGKLMNDSVFDSSVERGQPIEFTLGIGQVIPGWDEGLMLMNVGDKAEFIIPPDLAYGSQDLGIIPPNSTLKFEVELIAAKTMKQAEPYNVAGLDTLTTESGLQYIVLEEGSGPKASYGRNVSVHYTGYLTDGSKFDSSVERGTPFRFEQGAGKVIKGWDEGVCLIKKGGKARLIIPPELGYGKRDIGPIPANSTLIFDIEITDVE